MFTFLMGGAMRSAKLTMLGFLYLITLFLSGVGGAGNCPHCHYDEDGNVISFCGKCLGLRSGQLNPDTKI